MIEVNGYVLEEDLYKILTDVRANSNGMLSVIERSGNDYKVTCPFHSDGREHRPSCFIRIDDAVFHCFTDGESGHLEKLVAKCFDCSVDRAAKWLIDRYGGEFIGVKTDLHLESINLHKHESSEETYLDESILDTFESYHPYMSQRHLTDDVIKKFQIKYDQSTKSIVFPVRDINGRLVALTKRSVEGKRFDIQKGFNKKNVYLLDACKNEREVYVVESQINALTLFGWGKPAVALFGAGTTYEQMCELNKTGIKHFILCYDPDYAGLKGEERFRKYINKNCFVDTVRLPPGKDVNDLTKEEFEQLEKYN